MIFPEANFDGLVGPTHNYSGLAFGNEASQKNASLASNPRAAALQGLEKMRFVHSLGVPQGIFPPQPRPALRWLHSLGFSGAPRAVMERVANSAPELLPFVYSSSGMWAANAATVTPSVDNADGKVHFTSANLYSTPHRSLEAVFTARMLKRVFPSESHFTHHAPLPPGPLTTDEGAANHMRMRGEGSEKNLHVFVYGRDAVKGNIQPVRYPARQTLQASEAVARLHGLADESALFVQQHPAAIDAGVFHNDVISIAHENVLLYHECAFADGERILARLQEKQQGWHFLRVSEQELSLADTVATYLFNSQMVSLPEGGMAIIAPEECQEHVATAAILQRWQEENSNPIQLVHYTDLRQSMRNGGGPACLRLRVPLTEAEWNGVTPGVRFSEELYGKLTAWVEKHYRDRLLPADLADPLLAEEVLEAYHALEPILGLEGLYAD